MSEDFNSMKIKNIMTRINADPFLKIVYDIGYLDAEEKFRKALIQEQIEHLKELNAFKKQIDELQAVYQKDVDNMCDDLYSEEQAKELKEI